MGQTDNNNIEDEQQTSDMAGRSQLNEDSSYSPTEFNRIPSEIQRRIFSQTDEPRATAINKLARQTRRHISPFDAATRSGRLPQLMKWYLNEGLFIQAKNVWKSINPQEQDLLDSVALSICQPPSASIILNHWWTRYRGKGRFAFPSDIVLSCFRGALKKKDEQLLQSLQDHFLRFPLVNAVIFPQFNIQRYSVYLWEILNQLGRSALDFLWQSQIVYRSVWALIPRQICLKGNIELLDQLLSADFIQEMHQEARFRQIIYDLYDSAFSQWNIAMWQYILGNTHLQEQDMAVRGIITAIGQPGLQIFEQGVYQSLFPGNWLSMYIEQALESDNYFAIAYLAQCPITDVEQLIDARRKLDQFQQMPDEINLGIKMAEADELWRDIESGVDQIMTRLQQGLSYNRYMGLYTSVYNHCTMSRIPVSSNSQVVRGPNLMGEFLYEQLSLYLKNHLVGLQTRSQQFVGDELLKFYSEEWQRFTRAALYINRIFNYLNRHWVKRQTDEGNKNVYDVYTLCLVSWRDFLFMNIHSKVTAAMLSLIERHRLNPGVLQTTQHADIALLKTITSSYSMLGLDEVETSRKTLDVYKKYFQDAFIAASKEWYRVMAEQFMQQNGVLEYMKMAEARLQQEHDRVDYYLDISTMKPLISVIESVLIEQYKQAIADQFPSLLEMDSRADLSRTYDLLCRIQNGLDPLKDIFEQFVKNRGLAAAEQLQSQIKSQALSGGAKKSKDVDPKSYVECLLQVYRHFLEVVNGAFKNDAGFVGSLDKACREFVNRNCLCRPSTKSPEYLAKFADSLLKKGSSSKASAAGADDNMDVGGASAMGGVEEGLANIMTVFKYIEDKDVFQKFYSKMLAKRLVYDASVSDEAEASMISKLKEACGFEYTNKLSRMFTDMSLSRDLNDGFKSQQEQHLQAVVAAGNSSNDNIDFYIKILATGSWPLQSPTTPFNLPLGMQKYHDAFQSFYQSQHSGRKLNWLHHLSAGELKANYVKAGPKGVNFIFMAYTYAMGVLLAFNDSSTLTYQQLQQMTALNDQTLTGILSNLVKAKVLLTSEQVQVASTSTAGGATGKQQQNDEDKDDNDEVDGTISAGAYTPQSTFELNFNFKSKRIRVNLKAAIKSEQKAEVEETHKTVEEDRKMLIQAAIVRVMKTRQQIKHVQLVQEIINQVQSRFKPKIPDIKKCIDILIDKEYMERVEGQKDVYQYLA
ncbi:hypothetical protein MIR68_002818 [Amoeboaphelidium protococcarum]|nr:hypothetical protein MIR68_002818 [Amoeboaphelidium protococcarum]